MIDGYCSLKKRTRAIIGEIEMHLRTFESSEEDSSQYLISVLQLNPKCQKGVMEQIEISNGIEKWTGKILM